MTIKTHAKYSPTQSFVDSSFFTKLAELKLDKFKLDASSQKIWGFQLQSQNLNKFNDTPIVHLDDQSFSSETPSKADSWTFKGELINVNTIEEFKDKNKQVLLKSWGQQIQEKITSKKTFDVETFNYFYVWSYSDLKKYKFYYWVAFPILNSEWNLEGEDKVDRETLNLLQQNVSSAKGQFFQIDKGELFDNADTQKSHTFVYYDSCTTLEHRPSVQVKNYLYYLGHLGFQKIDLIIFKKEHSFKQTLSFVSISNPLKVTGWERTSQGKLSPKVADLGSLINPLELANQAVELNLKLMKWRIAPKLDLDIIKKQKVLLLGAGTLGSYVGRTLLGWGFKDLTFVDNGRVSYSNPVRQSLFNFEDCFSDEGQGELKAQKAADNLKKVYPGVFTEGVSLEVPMIGHPVTDEERQKASYELLDALIERSDVVFLLMDSRESRWLPTVMGSAKDKIVINAALGFDSYLVMRHGSILQPKGDRLGCYFCNDVVAPDDSLSDRTLDQMCTVTRPGGALMASSLAVELLVSILQQPEKQKAKHSDTTTFGTTPHQIRGFLQNFSQSTLYAPSYVHCSACSENVITEYNQNKWDFVKRCLNEPSYLEDLCGLKKVQEEAELAIASMNISDIEDAEDLEWLNMNQFTPPQINRLQEDSHFLDSNHKTRMDSSSPLPGMYLYSQEATMSKHQSERSFTPQPSYDAVELKSFDLEGADIGGVQSSCITVNNPVVQKIPAPLLSEIDDINIQQALIIKDLLFTLLGFEGHYIQHSKSYNRTSVGSRISGPDFKIAKNLDVSLKTVTKRIIRIGKHYSGLNAFIEVYDDAVYGKLVQAFCHSITMFFKQYAKLLLSLEHEYQYNTRFNINTLEQVLHQETANKMSHMYSIAKEIHELTDERQDLPREQSKSANLHRLETDMYTEKMKVCKGGHVLKIIQERIAAFKGDPASYSFLAALYDEVSFEYVSMLNQWLTDGSIEDPFDEFMIRVAKIPKGLQSFFQTKSDFYWNELFLIKEDGLLEQFFDTKIQNKIINTGKFLSMFKMCTDLHDFSCLGERLEGVKSLNAPDLELKIDMFSTRANKMLLKLLFEGYKFPKLVEAFQTLFLLDDSFKIDSFIDSAFQDLRRNKYRISTQRVSRQYYENFLPMSGLEIGHNTSCAKIAEQNQRFTITVENFFKSTEELMAKRDSDISRYDFRELFQEHNSSGELRNEVADTLPKGSNDRVDDITFLSVDLTVPLEFPLNFVLNRQTSYQYETSFKFLFMLKFVTKQIENNWQDINTSRIWTEKSFPQRVQKWILRCRMLHSRILTFVTHVQSYVMYDVIESNYSQVHQTLNEYGQRLAAADLGTDIVDSDQVLNTKLMSNYGMNTIFDKKINSRKAAATTNETLSVQDLKTKLETFTTVILSDTLLTRPETLSCMREMFYFIIQFQTYTIQMKKMLVFIHPELYETFSREFPGKFNKPMDDESVQQRLDYLDESFFLRYQKFGELLAYFLSTIKKVGEKENRKLLELSDRLESCFPE
ncbi:alp4 [Candida margitis]|uniref:alp4 n=1 Tax=Candida margitis TaxID=1775924 RepID=UPI0022267204|nr:alp4 [Candida margitis]KAI5968216.1 alp4 [Candida margitis]